MSRVSDGTNVPIPPARAYSSNFGSLHGSGSDLDGMGTRLGSTTDEKLDALLSKFVHFEAQIAQILGSARSWPSLEQVDGSTAAGFHGPGSSSDPRNTRRRLDDSSNPDDQHARSAVLLRFPCEQHHKGVTKWTNNLCEEYNMPADNRPVTIHCKAGSMLVRLVFETRAKCQDFVARYKDDGIPCEIDSPFCGVKTTIAVRQSRSIEDREIGKQFASLWRALADQLKILFPDGNDTGVPSLSQRSTPAHKSSASKIDETVLENPVFKPAFLGSGQLFTPSQHGQCVMTAFSLARLFAAWRVEAPFSAASFFDGFCTWCSL